MLRNNFRRPDAETVFDRINAYKAEFLGLIWDNLFLEFLHYPRPNRALAVYLILIFPSQSLNSAILLLLYGVFGTIYSQKQCFANRYMSRILPHIATPQRQKLRRSSVLFMFTPHGGKDKVRRLRRQNAWQPNTVCHPIQRVEQSTVPPYL